MQGLMFTYGISGGRTKGRLILGEELSGLPGVNVGDIVRLLGQHLHRGVLIDGDGAARDKVFGGFAIVLNHLHHARLQNGCKEQEQLP